MTIVSTLDETVYYNA